MPLDTAGARPLLQAFDFRSLFLEELGWDRPPAQPLPLTIDGVDYTLRPVAQKRGLVVLLCAPDPIGAIPPSPVRAKIDRQVARAYREHLIVYTDADRSTQVWQWVRREPGTPVAFREHRYDVGQSVQRLIQRLDALSVGLDEEEDLTIVEVTGRLRRAFDVDRVTKRFYDRFKDEHAAFLGFVEGIQAQGDREWYASLMLNRLMFVYFIQKKGFLDGDLDYLRSRLRRVAELGLPDADSFHAFYRHFLLRLFHDGLGTEESARPAGLDALLGKVPYLNGGLFDVHALEESHPDIQIPDDAFERLFDFFDRYTWHLDDRPIRNDNQINPDVLGYIFEKYINQKQMGAYYTKEDITGYIAQNTIIPYLFDAARKECAAGLRPDAYVWTLLREDPDRYIYPAVRKGTDLSLPPGIAAGLNDVTQRGGWNRPADEPFALPTETWREHVARRRRYEQIRAKLHAGQVTAINDLITLNLDIRQFALDAIRYTEGPDLLRAFYHAVRDVTVLDPTCGSGAFLFAALNVLEPLHDACLDRMRAFLDDLDRAPEPHHPKKFEDFRRVLAEAARHPNGRYFVLKQIVLNNLYGVDIMEEAVEICKLRLFLKLVAQLETTDQIEPLPDIDFNVRAGNTLVGFATYNEVKRAVLGEKQTRMDLGGDMARIEERAEIADRAFQMFHRMQTEHGMNGSAFRDAKAELRRRLTDLGAELDRYLATEYGVDPSWPKAFASWRASHQPFHWFVDFYGIMRHGGFDVIIGNPPYIAASKVRKEYRLIGYQTERCSDIYANVLERCANLLQPKGRTGMIVPLSLTFSGDFDALRRLLYGRYSANWFSSFARIPAALFSADVRVRNTIHLGQKGGTLPSMESTVLHRWFEDARPHLFTNLAYAPFSPEPYKCLIPKVNTAPLATAFQRCFASTTRTIESSLAPYPTTHMLHFKKSAYNWLNFCREQLPCYDARGNLIPHSKFGTIYFRDQPTRDLAFLLLNGKVMFSFWCMIGDDFDVTRWMFADLPVDLASLSSENQRCLLRLVDPLQELMEDNISFKRNAGKRVGNFNLAKCRSITDRSDAIFAEHLGLTNVWSDIELLYAQVVKTDFDQAEDE